METELDCVVVTKPLRRFVRVPRVPDRIVFSLHKSVRLFEEAQQRLSAGRLLVSYRRFTKPVARRRLTDINHITAGWP